MRETAADGSSGPGDGAPSRAYPRAMRPCLLLCLAVAACAAPPPAAPPAPKRPPDAAVCRDPEGRVVRLDPRIGQQTGLPLPRALSTRRAATFRAGPGPEDAALFSLEQPSAVVVLRECGFQRLVRLPDGRSGWVRASALTTRAPRATP